MQAEIVSIEDTQQYRKRLRLICNSWHCIIRIIQTKGILYNAKRIYAHIIHIFRK